MTLDLAYAATRSHRARVHRSLDALTGLAGTWAVSWSGGKDSAVCVDLAARAWPSGRVIVSDNQADSAEIHRLVAAMAEIHPHLTYHIRESLQPDSADHADLRRLLDRHEIAGQVLGLRANESGYRRLIARTTLRTGSYQSSARWGGRPILCPILDWSVHDVWAHTAAHGLPVHRCYQTGRDARSPRAPWREDE